MEPVFDPSAPTAIQPIVGAAQRDTDPASPWPGGDVIRDVYESDVPLAVSAVPVRPLAPGPIGRQPLWPFVAAAVVLALVLGGIAGFLIGNSRTDATTVAVATSSPPAVRATTAATTAATAAPVVSQAPKASVEATSAPAATPADEATVVNKTLDSLLAQTQDAGAYPTPSRYPQLDRIIAIQTSKDTATLRAQVAALTASQTQATDQASAMQTQLAAAQASLADAQKQRDDLTAQLAQSTTSASDLQQQIAARDQQIAALQAAAATSKSALDTANAALAKAKADLDSTKAQLTTATNTLAKLNPQPLANFVNGDVAKARSNASTNGWTIVEKSIGNSAVAAGTVTAQLPAPGATMVSGSVLYVEVAVKPAG